MPCAICGGSTLPAAKLCGACKAALKRARHETVSQLEPLRRRPSRGRRPHAGSPRSHADTKPPRRPPSVRLPAGVVALGVVVMATGYFGGHLRSAAHDSDLSAAAATPVAGPYVPLPTSAVPLRSSSEPFVLPARETLPAPPAPTNPPLTVRPAKTPPVPSRETVVEAPRAATVAATEPVAPPPAVAAKSDPPAPDRWQLLAAAIAQCGGGLGGMLCGERARWQYCDGYWGKVAQCPGAIGADVPR